MIALGVDAATQVCAMWPLVSANAQSHSWAQIVWRSQPVWMIPTVQSTMVMGAVVILQQVLVAAIGGTPTMERNASLIVSLRAVTMEGLAMCMGSGKFD